ncbi:MAG TPA: cytochrome c3 family protein [Pseudomonadota bacterium]|nr:cytochrome c3 family protein [Pseudomonadota bacterium]
MPSPFTPDRLLRCASLFFLAGALLATWPRDAAGQTLPPSGTRSGVDLWSPLRREAAPPVAASVAGPSTVVYPPQRLPLHFSHRRHLARGSDCLVCHAAAATSLSSRDNLLPTEAACRGCHPIERSRPFGPIFAANSAPPSACATCHVGFPSQPALDGQPSIAAGVDPATLIARVDLPPPALQFNHRLHIEKQLPCATCHGDLSQVDLATREQLPTMALCLRCHDGSRRGAGRAADRCATCHPAQPGGLLQVQLASGVLRPSGGLRGDDHAATDFRQSHGRVAQSGPDYCSNCHRESYCLRCHNAAAKPFDLHGGNYIARHAVDARRNQPDCSTCHRQQSFCLGCHQRLAVSDHATLPGQPATSAFFPARPRSFHPTGWSSATGGAANNLHAEEARRSQRSCTSCHREDTCLACHSTLSDSRVPGGANPHPPDWVRGGRCRAIASQNPRVCLKCHRDSDSALRCE